MGLACFVTGAVLRASAVVSLVLLVPAALLLRSAPGIGRAPDVNTRTARYAALFFATLSVDGPRMEPVKSHSSADLVAGGKADGVIAVPANVLEIAAGALVEFRPWRPLP